MRVTNSTVPQWLQREEQEADLRARRKDRLQGQLDHATDPSIQGQIQGQLNEIAREDCAYRQKLMQYVAS